jgi:hypothetical protein
MIMFSQLNAKVLLVVLLLSATVAKADGGLIFLEKNLNAQKETKAQVEKKSHHTTVQHKC